MALFTLSDIKFKGTTTRGPLSPLVSSQYQQNNKKYPIDLGSYDKGHYMVFYVNVQEKTQFKNNFVNDTPTVTSNLSALQAQRGITSLAQAGEALKSAGDSILSGVSRGINSMFEAANATGANGNQELQAQIDAAVQSKKNELTKLKGENLFRNIKRISDTVALYMPDTLNFAYNQSFSDVSLTQSLGAAGTAASMAIAGLDSAAGRGQSVDGNLSAFVKKGATSLAGGAGDILFTAISGGLVSNPQLELIYSSPSFRHFRYQFLFYPRSEREANEVLDIIQLFKFHQAPEILSQTAGRFLIPPSEFDIKFYYNGEENPNIPKISTCVLETVDVDYAPNGFAAYEVPGQSKPTKGGTGMPVGIRLDLQFKETQIMTKELLQNNQG